MRKNTKSNMYVDLKTLHNEVTGSCIICTVNFPSRKKIKFLVDCGLFQEENYKINNYSFPFDPKEIDFLLVTHTHIDHIGRIPKLYKDGFNGKTYSSILAAGLMPIALNNTAQILNSNAQKNTKKYKKAIDEASIPLHLLSTPLFDVEDVKYTMQYVEGKKYNKAYKLTNNISVTFIPNGHTLGSSIIFVEISYPGEDSIYLLFTGDYSPKNTFFDVSELPTKVKQVPINVIIESTYGNKSKKEIKEVFDNTIINAIKNNNTCIITVFAFGRKQEIALKLKMLQDNGLLNKDIPIYSDGKLANEYDKFYLNNTDYLKIKEFLPKNMVTVKDSQMRQGILRDTTPKIIVTTSGMGNYGPATTYLPYYISDKKCTIIFGGYSAQNTLGRRLQNIGTDEKFEINGITTTKKANVISTSEFSSHAKSEDLLYFLSKFHLLKSVLINHGETEVKAQFAKIISDELNPKTVDMILPDNTIRIGAYGFIKKFDDT